MQPHGDFLAPPPVTDLFEGRSHLLQTGVGTGLGGRIGVEQAQHHEASEIHSPGRLSHLAEELGKDHHQFVLQPLARRASRLHQVASCAGEQTERLNAFGGQTTGASEARQQSTRNDLGVDPIGLGAQPQARSPRRAAPGAQPQARSPRRAAPGAQPRKRFGGGSAAAPDTPLG